MVLENNNEVSPEEFVDRLLSEGSKIRCDDTSEEIEKNNVPPYYDEKLYRTGQKFFYKHLFSMCVCKFQGLIAVLSIPSILKILMATGMSSSDFSAYQRYMGTIFHTMVWYDEDFKPDSRSWKSLSAVRHMHNSASKKCTKLNIGSITQKDMALTQFGFMGFAITRSKILGIHDPTDEELEGFIHVWRVVGYLLGIEDRFNICSGSVQETKEICRLLIAQAFRPEISKKDKDFLTMSRYLCNGMSIMDPLLMYESAMCGVDVLVRDDFENEKPVYLKMATVHFIAIKIATFLFWSLRFSIVRAVFNYIKIFQLWYMKILPIPAYYKFGFKNSIVDIKV